MTRNAIAAVVLVLAAGAVLACLVVRSRARRLKERELRLKLEQKEERDFDGAAQKVHDVLEAWRSTRPDAITPDYDATLIVDLGRRTVRLEQGDLHRVTQAQLPDGYDWSLHRVTPSGHKRLPDLVRLRLRAPKGKRNVCQEVIHLQGTLGLDAGLYFSIKWYGGGSGTGIVLLDTYPFKKAGGDTHGVNQSLLVERKDANPRVQADAASE